MSLFLTFRVRPTNSWDQPWVRVLIFTNKIFSDSFFL
jgi:hypothetical protein